MNKLKVWAIEVGIKKFGPSAVRGAILGLTGFLAARHELLAPLGIVYTQATNILTIDFNVMSIWAVAALPAIGAGVIKILNHQGNEAVKAVIPPKTPPEVK